MEELLFLDLIAEERVVVHQNGNEQLPVLLKFLSSVRYESGPVTVECFYPLLAPICGDLVWGGQEENVLISGARGLGDDVGCHVGVTDIDSIGGEYLLGKVFAGNHYEDIFVMAEAF